MSERRALFVLSSDYGEYVTANLFSRGQPFARHFALPAALAGAAGAQAHEVSVYSGLEDLEAIVARQKPHCVVLASGYLFAVNRLLSADEVARLIARLRAAEQIRGDIFAVVGLQHEKRAPPAHAAACSAAWCSRSSDLKRARIEAGFPPPARSSSAARRSAARA